MFTVHLIITFHDSRQPLHQNKSLGHNLSVYKLQRRSRPTVWPGHSQLHFIHACTAKALIRLSNFQVNLGICNHSQRPYFYRFRSNLRILIQDPSTLRIYYIGHHSSRWVVITHIFLFLYTKICCGYSLEAPQWALLMSTHNIGFNGKTRISIVIGPENTYPKAMIAPQS